MYGRVTARGACWKKWSKTSSDMDDIRLDKYLWAVRVFKTRSDAADAVRTNKVTVNGAYAKPSREVKIGDVIAVRKMQVTYSYKVLDLVSSRQPAKNVPLYCLNVTPQEELDKLNVPRETVFVFRDRGTGRPTKKERRELDGLVEFVGIYGAKGLAWMQIQEDGSVKSPIAKFFSEAHLANILKTAAAEPGDLLLFVADKPAVVAQALGALRLEMAKRRELIDEDMLAFAWVVDFPMFEYNDEEKRYVAMHHPFTAPRDEDVAMLATDPGKVYAKAYDMVLNGTEIGGGSIRIHRRDVQNEVFKAIGLTEEQAKEKFGFMMDAFEFGAPPHGGLAFGLDRLIMIMAKRDSIRDVIAFPKTQSASCLMTQAPNDVDEKQLRELHIRATLVKKDK